MLVKKRIYTVILLSVLTFGSAGFCGQPTADTGTNTAINKTLSSEQYFEIGLKEYLAGNYPQAAENLTKAIEEDPVMAKAYYFLGYSYYKQGNMDKAIENFDEAYTLNPAYSPFGRPEEIIEKK